MLDPLLIVACCAGFGLTVSFFTLGHSRIPPHIHKNHSIDDDEEDKQLVEKKLPRRRVLVVTAHPDDECMFFGPTVLHFTQREKALVYLLCLSTGNNVGQGSVRRAELWESCRVLGISGENILIYRCDDLPDDPTIIWPTVRTANIINHHIHSLDIDMVITFDGSGVSGHPNHSSLHSALEHLVEENLLPLQCEAYSLDSVNLLRKYSSLLDVPLSYMLSGCAFTLDTNQYLILRVAMQAHASQYVWYRRLYMIFSRYVLINTLSRITIQ